MPVSGPVDLDTLPIALKDTLFNEFDDMSMPTPLFAIASTEGVGHPFFTRGELGKEMPVGQFRKRRLHRWQVAETFMPGIPWPIFEAQPSTDTLFFGKVWESPQKAARKDKKVLRVVDAAAVRGSWMMSIPATTYTVTIRELLDEIQMHLLEEVGGTTWSLWTHDEVLTYLAQRVVRFMMETGIIREVYSTTQGNGTAIADLPEDLMEIRRVAWDGVALPRIDPFVLDHGQVGWESGTGVPHTYIEEPLGPLTLQLVKTPTSSGTLSVIYIGHVYDLIVTNLTRDPVLPIPAAFCPHLKYGVMADMLMKEGEAHDPVRAEYCNGRYEEGVQLARLWMGALE